MRLVVTDLCHEFAGGLPLFSHLSFTLRPGVLTGLVGPSGSGKSTLLSILAGMEPVKTGRVDRDDVGRIGWIFQSPVGAPRRTAVDQVVFPQVARGLRRATAEAEAMRLLDRFQLAHVSDREFRRLSGGEQQRLAFARAIAADFGVLLIDEPTAQLDPVTARTVHAVIRELVSDDRIVLVATHDETLRKCCDDVIELAGAV
ncbi:ATP-binding cassette domain-containing protein [Microbacterium sp.]|uniref:ATP-binding cassette domain-containing protein n=1 Tax=Microbacterium sp. TaxID=51671 RepID=UPI0039E52B99